MRNNTLFQILTIALPVLINYHARAQNIVQNGGFEQDGVDWGWTDNFGLWYGFPDAAEGRNWAAVDGTINSDNPPRLLCQDQLVVHRLGRRRNSNLVLAADHRGRLIDWSPDGPGSEGRGLFQRVTASVGWPRENQIGP